MGKECILQSMLTTLLKTKNGYKYIYICQVLTGEYTKGDPNMVVLPAKNTDRNKAILSCGQWALPSNIYGCEGQSSVSAISCDMQNDLLNFLLHMFYFCMWLISIYCTLTMRGNYNNHICSWQVAEFLNRGITNLKMMNISKGKGLL